MAAVFFHSTTVEGYDYIKKEKNINPTEFDVSQYLDEIFPNISSLSFHFPQYVFNMRAIPYLGSGIYCFDSKKGAEEYQDDSKVICIAYDNNYQCLDFDSPEILLKLDDIFRGDFLKYIRRKVFDKETLVAYKFLIVRVENFLLNSSEEEKFPQMYCIILFLLCTFYKKGIFVNYDIVKKKFLGIKYTYYTIAKCEKIRKIQFL